MPIISLDRAHPEIKGALTRFQSDPPQADRMETK